MLIKVVTATTRAPVRSVIASRRAEGCQFIATLDYARGNDYFLCALELCRLCRDAQAVAVDG